MKKKAAKLLLFLIFAVGSILLTSVFFNNQKLGIDVEASAVSRPIVSLTFNENGTTNILVYNSLRNGFQGLKYRIRTSSGWSAWSTNDFPATLCGDIRVNVHSNIPIGEFTLQLSQQVSSTWHTWDYFGYVGNGTVDIGRWNITSASGKKVGYIQNGVDGFHLPDELPWMAYGYSFFDAVSIVGYPGDNVSIKNKQIGFTNGIVGASAYMYYNCSLGYYEVPSYSLGAYTFQVAVDGNFLFIVVGI